MSPIICTFSEVKSTKVFYRVAEEKLTVVVRERSLPLEEPFFYIFTVHTV
jgi:hypothetical protein